MACNTVRKAQHQWGDSMGSTGRKKKFAAMAASAMMALSIAGATAAPAQAADRLVSSKQVLAWSLASCQDGIQKARKKAARLTPHHYVVVTRGCYRLLKNSYPAAGYPKYAATYQIRATNIPR